MAGSVGAPDGFESATEAQGRSRVRYKVLGFTVALAGITYLDRVCISKTSDDIMRDLGLSNLQMGFVFSAFTLAYALFEIPTGAWGDRIGTRRVLTRIVVWWSAFTIATAGAFNYASLLVLRFLFGAGEAGAFPNASKTFSRWFPVTERGTAQGVFFMGAHLGGGLTPLLVTYLLGFMTWRQIFVSFGLVGFVWAAAWSFWFRDEPGDHPEVNPAELKHIRSGRGLDVPHRLDAAVLRRVMTHKSLAALCLMYFTQAYGFYFNITWLPKYLDRVRGFSGATQGLLAGLPLILSAAADLLGGVTSDQVTRRFGLRAGRCGVGGASMVVAGGSLLAGVFVNDALTSALLIAVSGVAASFLLGSCWGVCLDISGPHAGLVSACMNTCGQVGAFLSPIVLAMFINKEPANWTAPLCIQAGLYLVGAVCWWFVDPRKPIAVGDEWDVD